VSWIGRTLRGAWDRVFRWLIPPYRTVVVEETLPSLLKRRTLYVVQEDGFEEQAAMICPCGCRRVLHMNLLADERPCWRLTRHEDGTATLHPSVWRQKDCRSHFWFRRGRVKWCDKERK
jgi:hypothetical protein